MGRYVLFLKLKYKDSGRVFWYGWKFYKTHDGALQAFKDIYISHGSSYVDWKAGRRDCGGYLAEYAEVLPICKIKDTSDNGVTFYGV